MWVGSIVVLPTNIRALHTMTIQPLYTPYSPGTLLGGGGGTPAPGK